MARLFKALGLAAALSFISQVQALPITFAFNGTCEANCYGVVGPAITGGISTSDAGLADGTLTNFEISSFWMDFGLFTLSNSNSSLGASSLTLSADGQTFSGGYFRIDGVFGLFPGDAFDFLANEGSNTWSFIVPFFGDPSGTGSFTRAPTSVPEPATLSLLGAGLLAMGLARRRKRAAS